ncbi:hypothetical protein N9C31_01925 [Gammaproteobacteria bacterium]|nr:hypothetical protein [Gammaproteobacteria bacterium]
MPVFLTMVLSTLIMPVMALESLVKLDHAPLRLENRDKVLSGAKHFKAQCLVCHSMKYMRFDELSQEAGIIPAAMPVWDELSWGGRPPPDLSLVVKRRSVDWVYTFLRSYYIDQSSATGFNNLVWQQTKMPNPFAGIQGRQVLMTSLSTLKSEHGQRRWSEVLELDKQGIMSGEDFDDYVDDIVNYLAYASDPSSLEREKIAPWVLGYLCVLFLTLMALSIVYWDEVKRKYYREFKS